MDGEEFYHREVMLVGGPHDGKTTTINFRRQHMIVMKHPQTLEDVENLSIDEFTQWRWPEDFYRRGDDGIYRFDRTVYYKPLEKDDGR